MLFPWLYQLDVTSVALICLVVLLAAGQVGAWAGRRGRARAGDRDGTPGLNGLDSAVLGLLALLLGFTLAIALGRFEERRGVVLAEANAIGTAWLRAQLLPEPYRATTDALLHDYARTRLRLVGRPPGDPQISAAFADAAGLQTELWTAAGAVSRALPQPVPTGLFIQALNDMIDLQARRLSAARNHVPDGVLVLLLGVAATGSAFSSYAAALAGKQRRLAEAIVSVLIACVIVAIFDLDSPRSGFIQVSQQPMIDLAASMGISTP